MKKIIIAIVFLMFGLASFAQYTEDKLPSGLTVSTTANDADYTIIQKNGEIIVKAIRMDSLRSYMTEGMAANIESLDSVAGNTGQFIISDGVGWLAPVSAKYEGSGAYTFGYRTGATGWGSIVLGGQTTTPNIASGTLSTTLNGRGNTSSGLLSLTSGRNNTASGYVSAAFGFSSIASGDYSTAFGNGSTASGHNAISSGIGCVSSGHSSFTFGKTCLSSGEYALSLGVDCNSMSDKAVSIGDNNDATGKTSICFGHSNYSQSYVETVLGLFCDTALSTTSDSYVATDRLFTIGNGTSGGTRSNALVMLKNGNTTATGDWTIDGDLHVTGMVDAMTLPHMFAYFGDSTITYTFAASDTWYHLTNATDSMWIYSELEDFTVSGDTLIFGVSGDYNLDAHLGYAGGNGITYAIRYYNVTQGAPIPTAIPNTGRGTGNVISNNIATYAEGIAAGDRVVLQIKADATVDATLKNSTIRIQYLHD